MMNRIVLAAAVASLASGLAACGGGGQDATWHQGYSYWQSAARQDYTGGPLTGAAAGDACNHALQAVPDGFGDPSSADWTSGFTAGCTDALKAARPAAAAPATASPAAASPAAASPTATPTEFTEFTTDRFLPTGS